MKGIVILGAGGHGRGIVEILRAIGRDRGDSPPIRGFLDDDPGQSGRDVAGVPVLGTTALLPEIVAEHRVLIGVGDPDPRRVLAERAAAAGAEFAVAVHPAAVLYGRVEVGAGVVVGAGAVIAADTRLGPHVLINLGATVGHDCALGSYATVAPGANLGGFVTMEEGSFVGLGAVVVPGRKIGVGARLGPGSVLLEDLVAGAVAFGVPARVVDRKGRS